MPSKGRARNSQRIRGYWVLFLITASFLSVIYSTFFKSYGEYAEAIIQVKHAPALLELDNGQDVDGQCALSTSTPSKHHSSMGNNPLGSVLLQRNKQISIGASPRTPLSFGQSPSGDVAITVESVKCNTPIFAPDGVCPRACPFFAQEAAKNRACWFQCLTAAECGSLVKTDDIADKADLICRSCKVVGCAECAKGKGDTCGKCDFGYSLNANGTCSSDYWKLWNAIFSILGVVGAFLGCYLARLHFSPVTNPEGLKEGLAYRSSLKLRMPAATGQEDRPLWPVSTNMHAVEVAGPGLTLHMNFQLALIVWGFTLVVTWIIFTYFTSPDLLVLGLYPVDTPQQLCAVTLKGKEVQKRLLPTKIIYMILMFVGTAVFNLTYALYQRRRFLEIDDGTSMTDFVALCKGLPELSGTESVEDLVKECIEASTGEKVVGVSVCWAFKDVEEDVSNAIEKEIEMIEDQPTLPDQATLDENNQGTVNKVCGWVDGLFGYTGKVPEVLSDAQAGKNVEELLKTISSTDSAFIVFESEASRDKAVQSVRGSQTFVFQGNMLKLSQETCEPDTVKWNNFNVTDKEFYCKMAVGILVIVVALLVWCFGFYMPFAYYQASFAKQGEEPGFVAALIFSMLVVIGNQIMYFLCGEVADRVGFRFNDHQECLYITLFTLSCVLNLVVDLGMEFFLGYEAAISSGAHTADGRLLEDITSYQEIFDSYVMQKVIGNRLFAYCFPATFLIPFIMEPIFGIYVPFKIQSLLLRTHPEVRGREAETSMEIFAPMDMGRYGDLLLNFMLSVLIVFFPPGPFLKMMIALVVSHVGIYMYDQYRILRSVAAFDYASDAIDRIVQVLMGIPTAFIAGAIVFKGGCLPGSPVCLKEGSLGLAMIGAAVGTLLVHTFVIVKVVPMFDKADHKVSEDTYSVAAAPLASTWFSENSVHCLRSKYIYKHDPPCMFNTRGKQHLLKENPKIGIHFKGCKHVGADEYEG